MSGAEIDNLGTTSVRPGFEIDVGALDRWMREHVSGYRGPLDVRQFRGGQSNPTYRLGTPNRNYVLRRKPPGVLLKGAHAIEREAQVLTALRTVSFPVPQAHALCTDPEVIGTAFYVMDLVEGRIVWDATFPDMTADARAAHFDAMNATIAALHSVDYRAVGLGNYGRASSFFERQVARWSRQYLDDEEAGRDPNMDRLIEWLSSAVPPPDEVSLTHGDFRCDNMIFDMSAPRVAAVLDWELSTLGHPLADFTYHSMMYRMPPRFVAGLAEADPGTSGIPSEADYVAAYCRRTGRTGIPSYDYCIAFNMFRLAAIFHGIKGRVQRGTAASAEARTRAALFPELAALAWREAKRAGG